MKIARFLLLFIYSDFIISINKIYFVHILVNQDLEDPVSLANVQNLIDEGPDEIPAKIYVNPAHDEDNNNNQDNDESKILIIIY